MSAPLYATAPTPGALNELAEVEHVARSLGTPLMPWQRLFVRVATEYTLSPLGLRLYRYPTVILTVPRQSGKTTVVRALLTTRALLKAGRKAFITAQSGKDARERFFELVEQIMTGPFASVASVRAAADSTRLTLANGSRIAPFVPNSEALHGYNFEDLLLDEIFALDEAEGDGIIGAAIPAMQTHKDRQTIMISTKGTVLSTFLNKRIEQGRKATEDPESSICYMEWALQDGLDAYNPENWDFHPALGHTITKADIAAAAEVMSKGEFTRAFMNRITATVESVLPVEKWAKQQADPTTLPARREVVYAFEIAHDRSRAAIVAAWRENEKIYVKPVRTGFGTIWLPETLDQLEQLDPLAIGADKYTQNAVVADAIRQANPDSALTDLKGPDFATGSAAFKALIEDGTLAHPGHAGLDHAIATARTRTYGDGGWTFSHQSEPELIAAVVAVRLLMNIQAESVPEMMMLED